MNHALSKNDVADLVKQLTEEQVRRVMEYIDQLQKQSEDVEK